MKKSTFIYIIISIIILIIVFTANNSISNSDMIELNFDDDINKIMFREGPTLLEITDEEDIAKLITIVSSYKVKPFDYGDVKGYIFLIDLYAGSDRKHRISILPGMMQIDDVWYSVNEDLSKELIKYYEIFEEY